MADATNHFKIAYDKVVAIIKAAYPRFKDTDRIFIRKTVMENDLGFDDIVMITPMTDELLGERTNQGRDDQFNVRLLYLNYQQPEISFDELTQFAENLISTFESNRAIREFWHSLSIVNIDYNPELSELIEGEITDQHGFTMDIEILKGKYV